MSVIEKIQADFVAAGYQWQENVYNDGKLECSIKFTENKSPHYFSEHPGGDFGWGRFDRWWAWAQAHEWLLKKQAA